MQLERSETELERAFGVDFRVRGELTAAAASDCLQRAHELEQRVAVVLVDHALADAERAAILDRSRTLHPDARRALLIEWGVVGGSHDGRRRSCPAMAVGDINYYVLKPWIERDELFHRTVAEFVQEWSRSEVANLREVVVIASDHSVRGSGDPQSARPQRDPERVPGQRLAAGGRRTAVRSASRIPVTGVLVWMPAVGGAVLHDPTDAEIAEAWGVPTTLADERGRSTSW